MLKYRRCNSCCRSGAPCGPRACTLGARKVTTKKIVPTQNTPSTMCTIRRAMITESKDPPCWGSERCPVEPLADARRLVGVEQGQEPLGVRLHLQRVAVLPAHEPLADRAIEEGHQWLE